MLKRSEIKKKGRGSLKRHYLFFVIVCLLAAFLGTEFVTSLSNIKAGTEDVLFWAKEAGKEEAEEVKTRITNDQGILDVLPADILPGADGDGHLSVTESLQTGDTIGGNPSLGLTRGVLAGVVNGVTSGSFTVSVMMALNSITGSGNAAAAIWILGSLAMTFLVWFFLRNLFTVVSRRIFLEGRTYEKVPFQRFIFLLRVKKWGKAALTMFVTSVFSFLWQLTVIGGMIKRYSYYLVPYIVAENPDISPLQAIRLSRKMMKGHKWQCFIFELSFIGWEFLGAISFGLTAILYSNPYKVAAFSEYFVELRKIAKEKNLEGNQFLNDQYLYQKADEQMLCEAYADILSSEDEPEQELKGFRGFLANVFGISFFNRSEEKAYEERQAREINHKDGHDAAKGKTYPGRLNPVPPRERSKLVGTINYMRHYSVSSLILLYFMFCFIGWIWEVSQHMVATGEFVNRGVLHGPWLPIYGTGGILVLVVLNKLRKHPVWEFIGTILLCGSVEYFTALTLEMTHGGRKWWDYSGYFLNLHGRICAEGLLVFGLMGMVIVYVVAPLIDNLLRRIPAKAAVPVCVVLLSAFCADQVYSSKHPNTGKGITDTACLDSGGPGTVGAESGQRTGGQV